jgi:hypothetical protein
MVGFTLRRRIWWVVVTFVVTVGAAVAGGTLYYAYQGDTFGECKILVRRSIPSPDGSKSIVIFGKECGATVGFNTQASIVWAGASFSPEKTPPFFIISGNSEIIASWLGNTAVEISHIPGGDKVFRSEQSVGDVKIEYR